MKKRIVHLIFLLSIALCLFSCRIAFGEGIFDNPREQELLQEVQGGHYIKARPQIEALLRDDPDSVAGNFLMSIVFWNGEGNLHRALQYMKKALSLFEAKYCNTPARVPTDMRLVSWHQRLYGELTDIYGELDMRELEYQTHQRLAELYHAKLGENAVWCMIKLGMYEEAYAISMRTLEEPGSLWVPTAYNNLMTLEYSRSRYMASYEMSRRSVEYHAGKSCVVLMNHGNSLSSLLRVEESIEYYLKAAAISDKCSNNHPLSYLALVYLTDGRWQKSISAFSRVQKRKVDRRRAVQTEMSERSDLASILYTMGFAERAKELMTTVVNAPSRLGHNSGLKGQADMANRVVYFAILHDAVERAREAFEAYSALEPFWIFDDKIRPRVKEILEEYVEARRGLWSNNQKLFKDALHTKNREGFIVPNTVVTPNFLPSVVDSLGQRTVEFMVEEQIAALEPEAYEAMKSSFAYLRAYIAWRDGDSAKLRQYIDEYRRERVPGLKLIDLEVDFMEGDLLMQQGKLGEAFERFGRVFADYPSIFRSRDVRLPVRFDDSMAEDLSDVRAALKSSSRFVALDDAPFVISASRMDGGFLQLCIASATGQRFACSSTDPKEYPRSEGIPHDAEIIHNFLHVAFSPRVDMSQADIHSLNGSTGTRTADEALADILAPSASIRNDGINDVSDLSDE